jgi:hypothetical protein
MDSSSVVPLHAPCSMLFYDFVSPEKNGLRNRQPDLLRCLQIDDQIKLSRLLYRKLRWFGSFQDLVDERRSAVE